MAWYYIVLLAAYCGTIVSLVAVVLSENRNPVRSLAWITVLLMVPVFGVVLYIFFGRSLKNVRMITRRNRRLLRKREAIKGVTLSKLPLGEPSRQLIRMANTMTRAIYYPANHVEIFTRGKEKFDALLADIVSARQYIHLEYYIIADDTIGTRMADALIERARAGVKVRIIYDHIGSLSTKKHYFRRLEEAGVEVHPFFRVTFPHFATRINWRNHRKIAIIDGHTGYIGGMNVADRYIDGPAPGEVWRDTHLRISGPGVGGLQYAFAVDWNFMGGGLLEEGCDTRQRRDPAYEAGLQVLTSGPTSHWSNVAMLLHKAIAGAKKRVFIQTPYFLPTEGLLRAMQTAALARVDVRLMVPLTSDSNILRYATFSYIRECLSAGIKVYLYTAGMLHAKSVVIDDEFSSVGSTNFDFRSFECNFEGNVLIYSRTVNEQLAAAFFDDINSSRRVNPEEWSRRPRSQRIRESMFRLLSPVL